MFGASFEGEAEGNRVLTRANKQEVADPKPGELTMGRANPTERRGKARTRQSYKSVRRPVVRGNMPIEPGDSWFSPKYILV